VLPKKKKKGDGTKTRGVSGLEENNKKKLGKVGRESSRLLKPEPDVDVHM